MERINASRWKRFAGWGIPAVVLTVSMLWFYRAFIFGQAFGWDDDLFVFYPGANYFAKSIADGIFPFWLPGLRCGMPFYSDVQMGVFYPLKWLLVPFVRDGVLSQQAYHIYQVFQCLLAAALFYLLMRMHKLPRLAAAAGALVFCFSGFFALHVIFFASVEVMVWLPLILMAIRHYFNGKSPFRALLVSGSVLLSFLPGFPQTTLYISYFAIAYWFVLALREEQEKGGGWKRILLGVIREMAAAAGTFFLAILLGAAAFFPAAENWTLSHRAAYGYAEIADTSMPFYYLVNLFFPNFTGVPNPAGDAVQYWGFNRDSLGFEQYRTAYWHYWDLGAYAGQIGIAALIYSLVFIRSTARSTLRLICTLGAVLAVWFMLGRYGGLFRVLYEVLPGISAFRAPSRMSCVLNASQAVLAAFFITDLIRGENLQGIRRTVLAILGAYILFFVGLQLFGRQVVDAFSDDKVFAFSVQQTQAGIGFFAVITAAAFAAGRDSMKKYFPYIVGVLLVSIFFDLSSAHGGFHKGKAKASDYFADKGRVLEQLQAFQDKNGICRFAQVRNGKIKEQVIFPRNMGYMHDVEFPEGYVLFLPSSLNQFAKHAAPARSLDLLNIGVYAEASPKGVQLKVNPTMLPRASFYSDVAVFDTEEQLQQAMKEEAVPYRNQAAVVKEDVEGVRFPEPKPRVNCRTEKVNNNTWMIRHDAVSAGILFVSQSYYPGWKAEDQQGNEYEVIQTFGGLTGIVIPESGPAGTIRFYFAPTVFKAGAAVSVITFVLVLSGCAAFRMRKNSGAAKGAR